MQAFPRAIPAAFCLLLLVGWSRVIKSAPLDQLDFDIPEGEARNSLTQYAAQSGLQVLFGWDDVQGIRTHAIRGRFDAETAMQLMLEGTRLRYEFGDWTVTLYVVPPARAPQPARRAPKERPPRLRSCLASP